MILLIGLCYAELGPMFPISGGVVRYPHLVWGSFTSYSLGFITWIASAAVPAIEVEGALTYATRYLPLTTRASANGVTVHILTPLGIVVAVVLLAIFVAISYYGVRLFAQINNVLVWWKLFVIILVVVVFLAMALGTTSMGTTANFTSHGFALNGWAAVFTAISQQRRRPARGAGDTGWDGVARLHPVFRRGRLPHRHRPDLHNHCIAGLLRDGPQRRRAPLVGVK